MANQGTGLVHSVLYILPSKEAMWVDGGREPKAINPSRPWQTWMENGVLTYALCVQVRWLPLGVQWWLQSRRPDTEAVRHVRKVEADRIA